MKQCNTSTTAVPLVFHDWLPMLGRSLDCAMRGCLVFFPGPDDTVFHKHSWPDGDADCNDLIKLCARVKKEQKGVILSFTKEDETETLAHIGTPMVIRESLLVYSFEIKVKNRHHLNQVMFQLESSLRLLRETVSPDLEEQESNGGSVAVLAKLVQSMSESTGCSAAEQLLVNFLADTLNALRVSLGRWYKGRIKLSAISHQYSLDKNSTLVRDLTLAMEECGDQKEEIYFPATDQQPGPVSLLHQNLSKKHGAATICSLPMTASKDRTDFVLLIEWGEDICNKEALSFFRTTGKITAPALSFKQLKDRTLAETIGAGVKQFYKKLLGNKRTILLKIFTFCFIFAFAFLGRGEFRIPADVELTGTILRSIVAPFPGYIASSEHSAGDKVEAGQILATLDTSDLTLEELNWSSKYAQADLEYRKAIAQNSTSQAKIITQQKKQAEIQLSLLQLQKERATIKAPFAGTIVSGDLSQAVGGPVERGKLLFEMVPQGGYRILAQVDEGDISYLEENQQGTLVFNSLPGETFRFAVTKITPVSTAAEGKNSFRVEAKLLDTGTRLRPGMQGYGKIGVGSKPLIWLWTRTLRDRLRLLSWTLLP